MDRREAVKALAAGACGAAAAALGPLPASASGLAGIGGRRPIPSLQDLGRALRRLEEVDPDFGKPVCVWWKQEADPVRRRDRGYFCLDGRGHGRTLMAERTVADLESVYAKFCREHGESPVSAPREM